MLLEISIFDFHFVVDDDAVSLLYRDRRYSIYRSPSVSILECVSLLLSSIALRGE